MEGNGFSGNGVGLPRKMPCSSNIFEMDLDTGERILSGFLLETEGMGEGSKTGSSAIDTGGSSLRGAVSSPCPLSRFSSRAIDDGVDERSLGPEESEGGDGGRTSPMSIFSSESLSRL